MFLLGAEAKRRQQQERVLVRSSAGAQGSIFMCKRTCRCPVKRLSSARRFTHTPGNDPTMLMHKKCIHEDSEHVANARSSYHCLNAPSPLQPTPISSCHARKSLLPNATSPCASHNCGCYTSTAFLNTRRRCKNRSSKMREEDVRKREPLGNLAAAPGIAFEESPCMLKTFSTLYFDI